MRVTTNHYVDGVTTIRLLMMAVASAIGWVGEGINKVSHWEWRPCGQSCAFTREIRQGGSVA